MVVSGVASGSKQCELVRDRIHAWLGWHVCLSHRSFPGYGLEREAGFRLLKAMAKVIDAFAGSKDGWGLPTSSATACWGKRPQDLLATALERVIESVLYGVEEIDYNNYAAKTEC